MTNICTHSGKLCCAYTTSTSVVAQKVVRNNQPPRSRTQPGCHFLPCFRFARLWPVDTEPVKDILSTSECRVSASPVGKPIPVTTFNAPGGKPAASTSPAKRRHVEGVTSEGFLRVRRGIPHGDKACGGNKKKKRGTRHVEGVRSEGFLKC